jgi:predicted kinase
MSLLVGWIQTNFSKLVEEMKNSTHHYDYENLNPYHLEGDIWTHTMMVYNEAKRLSNSNNVHLAALLHDIGKPTSRFTKTDGDINKCVFYSHENISTYLAVPLLLNLKKLHPEFEFDLKEVLLLINWHSDLHGIGKINESGVLNLSNKDTKLLNEKYGYRFKYLNDRYKDSPSLLEKAIMDDLQFYYDMIDLNEADNNGRITLNSDEQGSKDKFKLLRNYIPVNYNTEVNYENDTRPEAIILSGIPNSGKSTFIKELLKEKDYVILSTDNLIMETFPELDYDNAYARVQEKGIFNSLEIEMDKRLKEACKERKNIILDRTNLTKKIRRKWFNKIPDKYYVKKSINFIMIEELMEKRNIKRSKEGKTIPNEVLKNMLQRYTLSGTDEFEIVEYILSDLQEN